MLSVHLSMGSSWVTEMFGYVSKNVDSEQSPAARRSLPHTHSTIINRFLRFLLHFNRLSSTA